MPSGAGPGGVEVGATVVFAAMGVDAVADFGNPGSGIAFVSALDSAVSGDVGELVPGDLNA
jgi:hypothetical protein